MEQKSSPDTDEYRYFDPKMIKPDGYVNKFEKFDFKLVE